MSDTQAPEDEVAAAERAVYEAISCLQEWGRPVASREMTDAISALIDLKITLAVEQIADRMQDASGVRP